MIFQCGPATISVDELGNVAGVEHRRRPGENYLQFAMPPVWSLVDLQADADEVELHYCHRDIPALELVLRHGFSAIWTVRLAFSNSGTEELQVEEAWVGLTPGIGWPAWGIAAGSVASLVILPADGDGPLLTAELKIGAAHQLGAEGFDCGQFTLSPGGRYVAQWALDWVTNAAAASRALRGAVPRIRHLLVGEPCEVAGGDTALVAPEALAMETRGDVCDLRSDQPGCFGIELRSARGTAAFDLHWVRPVQQAIDDRAEEILRGVRTGPGIVALKETSEALLVQRALTERGLSGPADAADALDLFCARLTSKALGPLELTFLSREFVRTGDQDQLELAEAAFLAMKDNQPGLALAATQLCLGLLLGGAEVDRVLAHLGSIRPRAGEGIHDQIAELEMILVNRSVAAEPSKELLVLLKQCGLHLGAGLPGDPLNRLAARDLAHLISVIALLPDGANKELRRVWGVSPARLAERAVARMLAETVGAELTTCLAWLSMGQSSE